jgi:hypothetical protein
MRCATTRRTYDVKSASVIRLSRSTLSLNVDIYRGTGREIGGSIINVVPNAFGVGTAADLSKNTKITRNDDPKNSCCNTEYNNDSTGNIY